MTYHKWFGHGSAHKQTDAQTGPILLPRPLTPEVKKNSILQVVPSGLI